MTNSNLTTGQLRRWAAIGYSPNRWSVDNVHNRSERFIVGTTGRQVGKTQTAAVEIDEGMCQPLDQFGAPWVGVLGSSYDKAELSVNLYIENLTRVFGKNSYRVNQNKHELTITDAAAGTVGARLKWLSADDAYGVVGYTFSKLVIDEAQAIPDEVFFKIRPTVDVRNASVIVFGTPDITQAQSWFEGLWLRGQDPIDNDYHSFSVASWETPWMKPETILDAKNSMPETEFLRLYGGKWVNDVGRIFPNPEIAIAEYVPVFDPTKKYIASLDLAIYDDFNVLLIAEASTRTVIFKDRWNQTDPSISYDRVAADLEKFGNPILFTDATSPAGMAMSVGLRDRGIRVRPVEFTAQNKLKLVHQLASDIQHRYITYPKWDDLLQEFRAFIYGRSPTGKLTAGAAAGYHDDIIMSLVLLNEGLHQRSQRYENSSQSSNYMESRSRRATYV